MFQRRRRRRSREVIFVTISKNKAFSFRRYRLNFCPICLHVFNITSSIVDVGRFYRTRKNKRGKKKSNRGRVKKEKVWNGILSFSSTIILCIEYIFFWFYVLPFFCLPWWDCIVLEYKFESMEIGYVFFVSSCFTSLSPPLEVRLLVKRGMGFYNILCVSFFLHCLSVCLVFFDGTHLPSPSCGHRRSISSRHVTSSSMICPMVYSCSLFTLFLFGDVVRSHFQICREKFVQ